MLKNLKREENAISLAVERMLNEKYVVSIYVLKFNNASYIQCEYIYTICYTTYKIQMLSVNKMLSETLGNQACMD